MPHVVPPRVPHRVASLIPPQPAISTYSRGTVGWDQVCDWRGVFRWDGWVRAPPVSHFICESSRSPCGSSLAPLVWFHRVLSTHCALHSVQCALPIVLCPLCPALCSVCWPCSPWRCQGWSFAFPLVSSLLSLPYWLHRCKLWCLEDSGIARCHLTRAGIDRWLDQGTLDVFQLESDGGEDRMGPILGWPMNHSLSSDMSGR